MASVNMQLIRMINKNNKSNNNNNHNNNQNNNNNQSSSGSGKVVVLVPPTSSSTSSKEATSTSKSASLNAQTSPLAQPSSPSVSLPALKKRTTVVKQNVPPPVPPRGSPRSKSNLMHRNVNKSVCSGSIVISSPINANHLKVFINNEKSGCDKVTEWLKTIYIPPIPSINNSHTLPLKRNAPRVPEMEIQFKSVKKMVETFSKKDFNSMSTRASSGCVVVGGVSIKCCKISDSSIVQARVGDFNSLQLTNNNNAKTLRSFDTGTDSGIDDSSREHIYPRKINQSIIGRNETMAINYHNLQRVMSQLSLDGEFV